MFPRFLDLQFFIDFKAFWKGFGRVLGGFGEGLGRVWGGLGEGLGRVWGGIWEVLEAFGQVAGRI